MDLGRLSTRLLKLSMPEIWHQFGGHVLRLVEANIFDESIADPTERYREMFAR